MIETDYRICKACEHVRDDLAPSGLCPRCVPIPCVVCGSVGGHIDPRTKRAKRTKGRCAACYAELHNARRRAARVSERSGSTDMVPPPTAEDVRAMAEAARRAHAPKLRTQRRGWRDLTPREASRRVRCLWRKRPAVEAFFVDGKLIYD